MQVETRRTLSHDSTDALFSIDEASRGKRSGQIDMGAESDYDRDRASYPYKSRWQWRSLRAYYVCAAPLFPRVGFMLGVRFHSFNAMGQQALGT